MVEYILHEHLAPTSLFSVEALSQLQCRADCLPQEQVASLAQMQPPSRPQQVDGMADVGPDMMSEWSVGWLVDDGKIVGWRYSIVASRGWMFALL